jgi:hypothetical protein
MIMEAETSRPAAPAKPLKIAYLTEWSPYDESGVLRKLVSQIDAWRSLGCEASLFAIAPKRNTRPALDFDTRGTVFSAISQTSLEKYRFARLGYLNKILTVPLVWRCLRAFDPDIIYYRQNGPWYPGLGILLSIAPTVIEINADEDVETKLWGGLLAAFYKTTQRRVLKHIEGFACVTGEIAKKYRALEKVVAVTPNAAWGEPGAVAPSGNTVPTFVFVCSRTVGESWHGVDKVFELARTLSDLRFNIVGLTADDFPGQTIPDNVIMHGPLHGEALMTIYRQSDIGFGSLAVHRSGVTEACPLKTREYLMFGLPVVVGYTEAEERLRTADYILDLGSHETNVADGVERIREFAWRWMGRRIEEDRSFLTSRAKAQQRLDLFNVVIARTTARVEGREKVEPRLTGSELA